MTEYRKCRVEWCENMLRDLKEMYLETSSVEKTHAISEVESAMRRQEAIIIPKLVKALRKHFGDMVTKERVGKFEKVSPSFSTLIAFNFRKNVDHMSCFQKAKVIMYYYCKLHL